MSPDELRRQRDLVAAHLAWLDAQLASLRRPGDAAPPLAVPLPPVPPVARPLPISLPATPAAPAPAVVPEIELDPSLRLASAESARQGCIKVFAFVVVAFVAIVVLAYVFWPEPAPRP